MSVWLHNIRSVQRRVIKRAGRTAGRRTKAIDKRGYSSGGIRVFPSKFMRGGHAEGTECRDQRRVVPQVQQQFPEVGGCGILRPSLGPRLLAARYRRRHGTAVHFPTPSQTAVARARRRCLTRWSRILWFWADLATDVRKSELSQAQCGHTCGRFAFRVDLSDLLVDSMTHTHTL